MTGNATLDKAVHNFVRSEFEHTFGDQGDWPEAPPLWARLNELGTRLWLDTGSLDDAGALWNRAFEALTTNNTLLNKEVQTGAYDDLVRNAVTLLADFELSEQARMLELAFILNATHGLRLVAATDAYVSVEEHTDLAHDRDGAVATALRYYAICPERFIVKIPFTPAGLLATAELSDKGVPVNHTLGFSARQNVLIARIGKPEYVNVFMGRLNSFVADNELGDGSYVGEKATLASQAAIRKLRQEGLSPSRQIGASLRGGEQIRDLAGLDVMTMPPKAARQFLELDLSPADLRDATGAVYEPGLTDGLDPAAVGLPTLWDVDEGLLSAVADLETQDLTDCSPEDLVDFMHARGFGDLLPRWTEAQVAISADEGKIPELGHWREALADGRVGLDSLMNLAGLNSFRADQKQMDARVAEAMG